MSKGLQALKETAIQTVEALYGKDEPLRNHKINELLETRQFKCIEKELKALEIISQNFKLVGNCLHAKNKYAEDGWVFVKEIEDEEELDAWKEVLL